MVVMMVVVQAVVIGAVVVVVIVVKDCDYDGGGSVVCGAGCMSWLLVCMCVWRWWCGGEERERGAVCAVYQYFYFFQFHSFHSFI
jgi:hypothetical protein